MDYFLLNRGVDLHNFLFRARVVLRKNDNTQVSKKEKVKMSDTAVQDALSTKGDFLSVSEKSLRTLMSARIPVMMVSSPGKAKTASVRAIAKEMGYDLVTIVASRMDAQDISGFPTRGTYTHFDKDGNEVEVPATEYAPQMWQHFVMEKKKVIIFLDEFSNAHPSTRASLLSFIQDRQFPNGDVFPEETIIVGAMNPTESAADGYELDKATSNRMVFLAWEPDFVAWCENFLENNFGEGFINKAHKEWTTNIVRFIKDNPGWLHKENTGNISAAGGKNIHNADMNDPSVRAVLEYAWPSRRSWHNVARVLAHDTSQSQYVEDEIIKGAVGFGASLDFRQWLNEHSKLNISAIVADPDKYKGWDKLEISDATMILKSAIDGANEDNIDNVLRIFEILDEKDKKSFAAPMLPDLAKCHHSFAGKMTKEKSEAVKTRMVKIISKYNDYTRNDAR